MYINTQTMQYPLSEVDIKASFPNTAFTSPFIAPEPYVWVFPSPPPVYNSVIEIVREIAPFKTEKGNYEQQWEIIPRFNDYTDGEGLTHTREDQENAAIAADNYAKAATALQAAKQARQTEVDAIKVTTASGKEFDGNEEAQTRMARAILALNAEEQTLWVLTDNTPTQVSREELQEALRLSGAKQTEIWIRPYFIY
jgi:hypothetical protein